MRAPRDEGIFRWCFSLPINFVREFLLGGKLRWEHDGGVVILTSENEPTWVEGKGRFSFIKTSFGNLSDVRDFI